MAKIPHFDRFGAIFPHFCPNKHCGPLPRAKFQVYRGNVSPLRDQKPVLDHLVKTIQALRLVTNTLTCLRYLDVNTHDKAYRV